MAIGFRRSWGQTKPPANTAINWADPVTRKLTGYWLFGQGPAINLANRTYSGSYNGPSGAGGGFPVASNPDQAYLFSDTSALIVDDRTSGLYNFTTPGVCTLMFDINAITPTTTSVVGSKGDVNTTGWILQIITGNSGGIYGIHIEMSNSAHAPLSDGSKFASPGAYCITPGKTNRIVARFDGANAFYTVNGVSTWTAFNANPANGLNTTEIIAPGQPGFGFGLNTFVGCHYLTGYHSEHPMIRAAMWDRCITQAEAVRLTKTDPYCVHVPRVTRSLGAQAGPSPYTLMGGRCF